MLVDTIKLSGTKELQIHQDEFLESPRETWENLSTMVCFHRRYTLGDKHNYKSNDYNSFNELKKQIQKDHDIVVIRPLFLYDHSGITISCTPFSCKWDSSQIGWAFISKESIREWFNIKRVTKKLLEKNDFDSYLKRDIETYNLYLTGEVYGFKLIENGEIVDSCWGFYGSDIQTNGILESLDQKTIQEYKEFLIMEAI